MRTATRGGCGCKMVWLAQRIGPTRPGDASSSLMPMFCTTCAASNPTAAARCAGCGADLGRRHPSPVPHPSSLIPHPFLLRVLALVPLLAALAAAGGYYRAESAAPAARFAEAQAAEAAGRYEDALDAYAAAGDFGDAAARRAVLAADLAALRSASRASAAALDAGRPDEAIALLAPVVRALPGDAAAVGLLAHARERQAVDLRRTAAAAEAHGDWLGAERALATLLATAPDDEALATRLTALRRTHAPLVFARDRALYVVGPNGADERLLTDRVNVARPVWSPDRSRVAFVSPDELSPFANATLYVVNVDGSGLTPLHDRLHPDAVPTWSPDGTRIAYTSAAAIDLRSSEGLYTVRVVDVATGAETDLTSGTGRHATSPTWSPSGDRLAVTSRPVVGESRATLSGKGEVYLVELATGKATDLTANRMSTAWRAWWSPTAERLLVYTLDRGNAYRPPLSGIYLVDARSGGITTIVARSESVRLPVWAPDGSRFAFLDGDTSLRVRSLDPETAERRIELDSQAPGCQCHPTWSPDGGALLVPAFPTVDSVIVPVDGAPGDPTPLPLLYDDAPPTFGPPQWSSTNPVDQPAPPSVAGTALDPA